MNRLFVASKIKLNFYIGIRKNCLIVAVSTVIEKYPFQRNIVDDAVSNKLPISVYFDGKVYRSAFAPPVFFISVMVVGADFQLVTALLNYRATLGYFKEKIKSPVD